MSGKRYVYVTDNSSDDDEEYQPRYKNLHESFRKFEDSVGNCKMLQKEETSSSSFDVAFKTGRTKARRPCMNKNAVTARENRIRKKKYLEQVESKLSFYQRKSKSLVNVIEKQDMDIKKLKGEVTYLRCILKNNTNITALLRSMNEGLSKTYKPLINVQNLESMDRICNRKCVFKHSENLNEDDSSNQRLLENNRVMKNCHIVSGAQKSVRRLDFDHTYTIPELKNRETYVLNEDNFQFTNRGIDTIDLKNYQDDENDKTLNYQRNDDQIISNTSTESTLTSVSNNLDEMIEENMSGVSVNELSRLNLNHYDNFKNFDRLLSPMQSMETIPNLFDDSTLLDQFEDAGICLHLNSNRISLEFCSVCHMNSINSSIE